MPSTLELSRYHVALRFLQEGRREWALVLVGELLHSSSGRALALRLLEEMYRETSRTQVSDARPTTPTRGFVAALAALNQGV